MFLTFYSSRAASEQRFQDLLAQLGGFCIAGIVVVTALVIFRQTTRKNWAAFSCLLVGGAQVVLAANERVMDANLKALFWFTLILLQLLMATILCNSPHRRYCWPIFGATLLLGLHWDFASLRGGTPVDDPDAMAMEEVTYYLIAVIWAIIVVVIMAAVLVTGVREAMRKRQAIAAA